MILPSVSALKNYVISLLQRMTAAETAIAGKADTGHTHAISDVTGLTAALAGKQDTLVSGTNIKTVNGTSLLGSGNIAIAGGSVSATQVTLDFGSVPVGAKGFSVSLTGATVGQKVLMLPAADTDDDELEMDGFSCAARVSAADTIKAYIQALPGPVKGQRRFNIILG